MPGLRLLVAPTRSKARSSSSSKKDCNCSGVSKEAAGKFNARNPDDFQEIECLQDASEHRCKNVVGLVQAIEDTKHFYIITPYMRGGTLVDFLKKRQAQSIQQREVFARRILLDIAKGLQDLHNIGIVHRDIKPLNILLTNNSQDARARIADFGVSFKLRTPGYTS